MRTEKLRIMQRYFKKGCAIGVLRRRIGFTKESAACSAFPHQVHGPGQRARVGECPRVHASVLGVEAAAEAK